MEEKLTELQKAEIKKAFSICDKDGNGSIDANELKTVMAAILDEEPTDSELKELMKTLDSDHSGTVEWEEFLEAMTNWFGRDYTASGKMDTGETLGGKRKRSPEKERREVHKKIKSFFAQFKKGSNFDKIRTQIQKKSVREIEGYEAMRHSNSTLDLSSAQKLQYLGECKKIMESFESLVNRLNSDSHHLQLEGLTNIAKLLAIVEIFRTPHERRGVAEVIIKIFEMVVQTSITPRVIHLLQYSNVPQAQELAARIISYFAPGPRIASTPEDSLLHPNQMFFKKLVVSEGAVPILIKLLDSPYNEVKIQCVLALGCIAAHNPECRDHLLRQNVVLAIRNLVSGQFPVELLKAVSWLMSLLCGVTHPRTKLPGWDLISPMLPQLGTLLFAEDSEILANVCSALAIVLPGVPEPNVCKKLVQLLDHPDDRVVRGVLQTIVYVLRFDDKQTQFLLDFQLVAGLKGLLKAANDLVRVDVCEALIVLAGVRKRTQAIVNADLVPKLLKLLAVDELIRWKVAKVVKYLTRGTPTQVEYLVKKGTVNALTKALAYFKVYDQVLTQIYKFCGPSFNFEFVRDILIALENIINVGEMEAEEKQKLNQYALTFDMGCVDGIRGVLLAIKQSPPEELEAWRQKARRPGETSIEDKIKSLLFKIKRVHDANEGGKVSRHISQMIAETWNTFFGSNTFETRILIKCYCGDDIRVLEVHKDIKFEDIYRELQAKYGKGITVTYADAEGDPITLDSQSALETAIEMHIKDAARTLKLKIATRSHLGLPIGTPSPSLIGSPYATPRGSPPGSPLPMFKRDSAGQGETSTSPRNSGLFSPAAMFPITAPSIQNLSSFSLTGDLEEIKREEKKALLENLHDSTHFTLEELEALYSNWQKQAKNGLVGKAEFEAGLKEIGILDPLVLEQNFSAFDVNKDGQINFKEFVTGLSVVQKGTMEERLKFLFNAYDTDGSGTLTPDEVFNIFKASLASKGQPVDNEEITKMVNECFRQIDVNNDGEINFEEFKAAVANQQLMINCFVHYPAGQQSQQQQQPKKN